VTVGRKALRPRSHTAGGKVIPDGGTGDGRAAEDDSESSRGRAPRLPHRTKRAEARRVWIVARDTNDRSHPWAACRVDRETLVPGGWHPPPGPRWPLHRGRVPLAAGTEPAPVSAGAAGVARPGSPLRHRSLVGQLGGGLRRALGSGSRRSNRFRSVEPAVWARCRPARTRVAGRAGLSRFSRRTRPRGSGRTGRW
jgi:hypothetical protein